MFYDVCCWGSRDELCTAALLFATVAAQWQAFPCNAVSSHNLLLCVVLHKTRACLCVSACNTRVFVRYLHAGSSFSPRGSTPEVTWFPPSKARSIPGGEEPHSLCGGLQDAPFVPLTVCTPAIPPLEVLQRRSPLQLCDRSILCAILPKKQLYKPMTMSLSASHCIPHAQPWRHTMLGRSAVPIATPSAIVSSTGTLGEAVLAIL